MKRIILLLSLSALCLAACNSGGPDAKVETKRVDAAKSMREIFDSAHGNYDQLTPEKKAEFIKLFNGNEDNAKRMWGYIKQGGEGGATTGPRS